MAAEPGTLAFVREVTTWAVRLAVIVVVVSARVTRDWRFPLSFAIGAALDIGTIALLLKYSAVRLEAFAEAGRSAGLLIGGRLALKAVLLATAAALPSVLDLAGVAAGVLVFDATLMTVGSYSAAVSAGRWRVR